MRGEVRQHYSLEGLSSLADDRRRIEQEIGAMVGWCRGAGASWAKVGAALGVSGQAAQQRYGH